MWANCAKNLQIYRHLRKSKAFVECSGVFTDYCWHSRCIWADCTIHLPCENIDSSSQRYQFTRERIGCKGIVFLAPGSEAVKHGYVVFAVHNSHGNPVGDEMYGKGKLWEWRLIYNKYFHVHTSSYGISKRKLFNPITFKQT